MTGPVVAGRKPALVRFEKEGDALSWCACGRSANQPFCDGAHKGTAFRPLRIVARAAGEEALLCVCKQTKSPPYCDGSHNALGAYGEDHAESEIDYAAAEPAPRSDGALGRADLDGGCFVLTPDWRRAIILGGVNLLPTITRNDGADQLSQFILSPKSRSSGALSFGDAEVVLFLAKGAARVEIGAVAFEAQAGSAIAVRPAESFAVAADVGTEIIATVCPPDAPRMTGNSFFDQRHPERVTSLDDTQCSAMGTRFYQVLTSPEKGSDQVTQFIGAIPLSRAAAHRHLYEEALYVISGEGVMWTQSRKAAVKAGDVIYLPRKQIHSLECTAPQGMTLAGSFFPAGSPAINY